MKHAISFLLLLGVSATSQTWAAPRPALPVPGGAGGASGSKPVPVPTSPTVLEARLTPLYDDPRLVAWSRDYLAGKRDQVLAAVEADLKAGAPHPLAGAVWCTVHERLDDLRPAWNAVQDPALRQALEPAPEIRLLSNSGEYRKLLESYPLARAAEVKSVESLQTLGHAAETESRPLDALGYALAALHRQPDYFDTAWWVADSLFSNERVRAQVSALIKPGGEFAGTLAGALWQAELDNLPATDGYNLADLAAVDAWRAAQPHNPAALRAQGLVLASLERPDQAAAADAQAMRLYAFNDLTPQQATQLIKTGHTEATLTTATQAARRVLRDFALLRGKDEASALPLSEERLATAQLNAGERGQARLTLNAALQRWPNRAGLLTNYAYLELLSQRNGEAVEPARKAAQLEPDNLDYQLRLIEALKRTGKAAAAWALWEAANHSHTQKSLDFYYRGNLLLEDLQKPQERLQLLERARREYPESHWLLRESARALAQAERYQEAVALLDASFTFYEPYQWSVQNYRQWSLKAHDETQTNQALTALRQRFPWVQELWSDAADQITGTDKVERKAALWRQAIAANPGRMWAWRGLGDTYGAADRWDEATATAQVAVTAAQQGNAEDRADAIFYRGSMATWRSRHVKVSDQDLIAALRDFTTYAANGDHPAAVLSNRADLLLALGRSQEAATAALEAARLRPDTEDNIWGLLNHHLDVLGAKILVHIKRHVDRDPYDGKRLRVLANVHTQWSGSPIVALQTIKLMQERAPDQIEPGIEGQAWGQLGDGLKDFDLNYSHATSISNSNRYVGWYDSARYRAQGTPNEVSLEYQTGIATIVHPNGQIERRQDHPVSGKRMLLQVGAAYVKCRYDAQGNNLLSVEDSAGNQVRLDYDASDRIARLRLQDGQEVSFVYNAMSKPTRITVQGLGVINVAYKPGGTDIVKVESPQGRAVALKVTSAFQKLLDLIHPFETSSQNDPPELPYKNAELNALRAALSQAEAKAAPRFQPSAAVRVAADDAALRLATYLSAHVKDRRGHEADARALLEETFNDAQQPELGAGRFRLGLRAVTLWHDLMQQVRGQGLGADDWKQWNEMRAWVAGQVYVPGAPKAECEALVRQLDQQPLALVKSARWLPKSYLSSPGYWRRFRSIDLVPAALRHDLREHCVLIRQNGDVVVGTRVGLAVLRRGFWEWFGFDEARGRLASTVAPERANAAWDVLCLAEATDGALWLGSANGLLRLPGAYDGECTRWQRPADGLPTPRVDSLAVLGQRVLIGTAKGLRVAENGKLSTPTRFADEAILLVRAVPPASPVASAEDSNSVKPRSRPAFGGRRVNLEAPTPDPGAKAPPAAPAPVLVATAEALWGVSVAGDLKRVVRLAEGAVQDAYWDREQEQVFLLRQGAVWSVAWDGRSAPRRPLALPGQEDIYKAQKIAGLAPLPLDGGASGVAVLTDQGLSIYHDEHFEAARLPLADRAVGVEALSARDGRSFMLTSDGVYGLERGQVLGDNDGRVYDLLTDDDLKATFVARGDSLQVVWHNKPREGARHFASVAATCLARDGQGRLLANDGRTVVRFAKGAADPIELFDARPNVPEGYRGNATFTSLLAASDGTIWASAGPSVFRWREGRKVEEFSIMLDSTRFPARSNWIARVVETTDHRIWAIASDEGHLDYRGMKLMGGVVEWTGTAFRRIDLAQDSTHWFITGYTPLDDGTAIVGTSHGFAQQRGDHYASFRELKDASYEELFKRMPQLFLGTRGARLGTGTWLFGTGGGLVAYQDGQWFYPDRVNWMLPDDERCAGKYGVRTVHAVATDKAGRIYAGTDRGLLIYDSGGGDPISFLVSNAFQMEAYRNLEQDKLRREAQVLLAGIKPDSAQGRWMARVQQGRRDIAQLEARLWPGARLSPLPDGARSPGRLGPAVVPDAPEPASEMERTKLQEQLEARRKAHTRLLLELEREQKSLYQMLELKPLELVALRSRLGEGEIMLQYLPTPQQLYIQVVTRDAAQLRQVDVPGDELQQRAVRTARELAYQGVSRERGTALLQLPGMDNPTLEANLAWLYDKLLRPVESDLDAEKSLKHVFIVPVGALTYVPFAALVRQTEPQVEYAVQRYTFGYLPSLYLWDLVLGHTASASKDALIFGDPDNSLPGARAEAGRVFDIVQGTQTPLLGEAATYEKLLSMAPRSCMLHLATHGKLDEDKPENSYLLLAGGRRFSVIDAQSELDLKGADLVVLSACETGLGKSGLEYATLARAFAGAGAPCILATLWPVDDRGVPALVEAFYQHRQTESDNLIALAQAQRALLAGAEQLRRPGIWAGYIPFGKA